MERGESKITQDAEENRKLAIAAANEVGLYELAGVFETLPTFTLGELPPRAINGIMPGLEALAAQEWPGAQQIVEQYRVEGLPMEISVWHDAYR